MENTHSTLSPNMVLELRVDRITPVGAFLDTGTGNLSEDILLHKNQQTEMIKKGDLIKVYLYLDTQERLTASMRLPILQREEAGWLIVKTVGKIGAFLDNGTEKDVLLPYSEMTCEHPVRGEEVFVALYADKSGRTAATMNVENWLKMYYTRSSKVKVGEIIKVRPYLITPKGASVVTEDLKWGIIPGGEGEHLRRGEVIDATVTRLGSGGRLYLSPLRHNLHPEDARSSDAQAVLLVLMRRGGEMPYSDETSPEVIRQRFDMSKGTFKKALGKLIKEGRVEQEGGWTRLLK